MRCTPEPGAKRQRTSTDANDAELAELLLGLSNSPRSSPRTSNISDKDCLRLSPLSSQEVVSQTGDLPNARRSQRVGKQPLKLMSASPEEEEDSDEAEVVHTEYRLPTKQQPTVKEVPARCKCGKRVSASHPPCKSELMLLSEKFRDRFAKSVSQGGDPHIDLNDCALALGVPRRRLYDITIVYEAAEVVRRTGKLAYVWQGLSHLPELIQRLRREEELGLPVGDRRGNVPCHAAENTHSLWALSRKFIRLLLTHQGAIQLSDAAAHLIGRKSGARPQTYLTVERRLYDIGSILSTLNLIKRTYVEGKRQPSFSWNWAEGENGQERTNEADRQAPFGQLAEANNIWADRRLPDAPGGLRFSRAPFLPAPLLVNRQQQRSLEAPTSQYQSPDQLRCFGNWTPAAGPQATQASGTQKEEGVRIWPALQPSQLCNSALQAPGMLQLSPALYQASLMHFLQQCGGPSSSGHSLAAVAASSQE